ncbi:MAG: gamma-glutamyl-gamma-aminobutyrate hydrolase family protein [Eubacteriales bacterium]|nr:gamma-glutamyl-gamma-aminobutyrate hydrolase family protein [Eubacteriales bacterium]
MRSPMILISSGREMGSLSMQRRQSALYGDCLAAVDAAGVLHSGGAAETLAARCDGLLLAGGGDLHPARYGQQPTGDHLSLDPVRDSEEAALFAAFFARGKPILGICRGVQAINVFLGGTLRQHIEGHADCCHALCRVRPLPGAPSAVNSYHHQAVDRPAPSLCTAAYAPDGTIEALLHPAAPVLGVQWHPERMVSGLCDDVTGTDQRAVFAWLRDRC